MDGRPGRIRVVLLLALVGVAVGGLAVAASSTVPTGRPFARSRQVIVVAAPRGLRLADLRGSPDLVAAANVDSPGRTPGSAWATVGAGAAQACCGGTPSGRGRLGDAVRRAGRTTGIVAPAPDPPSRLAVAGADGGVDLAGFADEPGALGEQASLLLRTGAALLLVDGEALDGAGFDALLERLRHEQVPLLVVSTGAPDPDLGLAPFRVSDPSGGPGGVLSSSTRQVGLVLLADVAPTALDVLGIEVPAQMTGRPLRRASSRVPVTELVRLDERSRLRTTVWNPAMAVVVLGLAAAALWAWRWPGAGLRPRAGLTLLLAGWPLATWLSRAVPGSASASAWALVLAVGFDLAVVVVAWLACRGEPLVALAGVLGATVALVTIDLGFGGPLQLSSAFGSDASTAGRFYGLGNGAFAAYAGAAAVLVACARRRAPWLAALLLLVTLVVAMPALGDDVGGALTLGPVFGLAAAALWARFSWRVALGLLAATALLVAVAIAIDLSRPAASRTHMARFVTGSGQSTALGRRIGTNLSQYPSQPALIVLVLLAVALGVLLATGRFTGTLPVGTPARIGVGTALGVALVGNAVNDSGAVVTAVVALSLVPYLVLRVGPSVRSSSAAPRLASSPS